MMSIGRRQIVFREDKLSRGKRLNFKVILDFWPFDRAFLLFVKQVYGMLIAMFLMYGKPVMEEQKNGGEDR